MNSALKNLHTLLKAFVDQKGSDLFITANAPVFIKKAGQLQALTQDPLTPEVAKALTLVLMNEKQQQEFLTTHECNFAYLYPKVSRFRINAFFQRNQPGLVVRVINSQIPIFDDLGLPSILKDLIMEQRGLILFVGGTGSGKSTSLASLIGHRNQNSRGHIITIEDPIEFVHPHQKCLITQREVGVDTESYEIALKNTLRQAPDVILIGEVRAQDTMEYAITFAETGHLCLSTLHANNANQALDRIINFFPEERHAQLFMDLSLNLKAIVSQRLIPKIGGGRIAAIEVLINTPRMADLIFEGKIPEMKSLMKDSEEAGMQTFDKALFDLYEAGQITYEDALRSADSMNDLRLNIKLNSQRGEPNAKSDHAKMPLTMQLEKEDHDATE